MTVGVTHRGAGGNFNIDFQLCIDPYLTLLTLPAISRMIPYMASTGDTCLKQKNGLVSKIQQNMRENGRPEAGYHGLKLVNSGQNRRRSSAQMPMKS